MKKVISILLAVSLLFAAGFLLWPQEALAATGTSQAGVVSVSGGSLNVRSAASTGSAVAASLGKGSYVTLISKSGSWWRVEYGRGQYGYCHADYITAVPGSAATVNTSSGNLNVRSGAGTAYAVKDSLAKGETVIVLSVSGGWSRILYYGVRTGYVSSRYLSSQPAYGAVSLAVPDFKQTDSRWANVEIGSSGRTIAQIGCATTALAMTESCRTGRTIYPDAMSRQLSYSSTGSVYWPSNYTPVTDSSGYLSAIYRYLRSGKPILFGAKTSTGSQHWVVITGYTGGNSLSASGFTIRDPGSAYRTNLQQLLDKYPVFYKYFYYN